MLTTHMEKKTHRTKTMIIQEPQESSLGPLTSDLQSNYLITPTFNKQTV